MISTGAGSSRSCMTAAAWEAGGTYVDGVLSSIAAPASAILLL